VVDISVFLEIWETRGFPGVISVLGLAISVSVFSSVAIAGLIDLARKKDVGANLIRILLVSFLLATLSACTTYYFVLIPEGAEPNEETGDGPLSQPLDRARELVDGRWAIEGFDCSDALLFEVDRGEPALVLSTDDGIHTSYKITSVYRQTVRVSYTTGEEIAFVRSGSALKEVSSNGQARNYRRCEA
jgi:hypothetical protein